LPHSRPRCQRHPRRLGPAHCGHAVRLRLRGRGVRGKVRTSSLRKSETRHKPAETAGVLDGVSGAPKAAHFDRRAKGAKRKLFGARTLVCRGRVVRLQ
jgi:hypothetical protein